MKIVCISDVHEKWENLVIPKCDILISAGDYSFRGDLSVVLKFHHWLALQPAKHIISVQGNHEKGVEKNFNLNKKLVQMIDKRIHFIEHESIEIEGIKIFGSAVTPYFGGWAWNFHRGQQIKEQWDKIPKDTQILISHGPAAGILDELVSGDNVGCMDLLNKIKELKDLKLHVFGHIHNAYGTKVIDNITHINAAICTEDYRPLNKPIIYNFKK